MMQSKWRWYFVLSIAVVVAVTVAIGVFRSKQTATTVGGTAAAAPAVPARPQSYVQIPVQLRAVAIEDKTEDEQGSFSGRVLDASTKRGISGAELSFAHGQGAHSVNTDATGVFTFRVPDAGSYALAAVTAEGYFPYSPNWGDSPIMLIGYPGKHVKDLVFYLKPSKAYNGRVLDPKGAPVEGAVIQMFLLVTEFEPSSLPSTYKTDAKGEFRFVAIPGTLVEASHPKYSSVRKRIDEHVLASGPLILQLGVKQTNPLAVISGTTLDPVGNALASARVVGRRSDAGPFVAFEDWHWASTDSHGRFELFDLAAGKYSLVASFEGMLPAKAEGISAGSRDIVLHLSTGGGQIVGVVKSADDDKAVPSFTIVISERQTELDEKETTRRSVIDASGHFSIDSLPPRDYVVRALAYGYAPAEPKRVAVTPGKDAVANFSLGRGGKIIGSVVEADTHAGIASAAIVAEGVVVGGTLPIPVTADATCGADGHFELVGLAPGQRSINASADGHNSRVVSGLQVTDGEVVGPITIALSRVAAGEKPQTELIGIGAKLAPNGDTLTVGTVSPGGGAAAAGLVSGDAILAIDGTPVGGLDFGHVVQLIRGEEGTTVVLLVRRASGEEVTIQVTRMTVRG
jgi:hypothetical protein